MLSRTIYRDNYVKETTNQTNNFASRLSKWRDLYRVAPLFVTVTMRPLPLDCEILSHSQQRKKQNKNLKFCNILSHQRMWLAWEKEHKSIQHLRDNGGWDTERIERDWEKRKFYLIIEMDREKGMVKQEEGRNSKSYNNNNNNLITTWLQSSQNAVINMCMFLNQKRILIHLAKF